MTIRTTVTRGQPSLIRPKCRSRERTPGIRMHWTRSQSQRWMTRRSIHGSICGRGTQRPKSRSLIWSKTRAEISPWTSLIATARNPSRTSPSKTPSNEWRSTKRNWKSYRMRRRDLAVDSRIREVEMCHHKTRSKWTLLGLTSRPPRRG